MHSILNEMTSQIEMQIYMTTGSNVFWTYKVKTQQKQSKHKHIVQNHESNPETLASQSGVLPLSHRDNCTCQQKSSYLNVSTLWGEQTKLNLRVTLF